MSLFFYEKNGDSGLTILLSVKVLSVRISIIMHYLFTVETIKTKERNSKELKKMYITEMFTRQTSITRLYRLPPN